MTKFALLTSAIVILAAASPAWAEDPPAPAAAPAADAAPAATPAPDAAAPAAAPTTAEPPAQSSEAPPPVAPRIYTVQPGPDGQIAAAPSGMAQIVFFRPNRFMGMALTFTVREDTLEMGQLANGRYFVLAVPAGEHTYAVRSEATDRLTMEVEAGETYYVQQTIEMGVVAGRPNLSPSDQATFQRHLRGMRVSTWRSRQPNSPAAEGAPTAPVSSTAAASGS